MAESTSSPPEPSRFSGALLATTSSPAGGGESAVVPARKPAVVRRVIGQQVPDDILHNKALNDAIDILPANYNFEIHKTLWRIRQSGARHVALQFPEGLLMYACVISDILESFGGVEETFVMGDVTFGACCIDDYSAEALGADLLVHYGHSCLVPVDVTRIPCMYVFVDIKMDLPHFLATVRHNFPPGTRLLLAGTIQFASSIQAAKRELASEYPSITVPQARPLSPGEVLGCTAPKLPNAAQDFDALLFLSDGRFHLEAIMMANPSLPAYRYDPYGRVLTREEYDHAGMRAARRAAIEAASKAQRWGLVLGTLGRQGNPRILDSLQGLLAARGRSCVVVLLSEVTPAKLAALSGRTGGKSAAAAAAGASTSAAEGAVQNVGSGDGGVEVWVQVACPRLSIDWGEEYPLPTLNSYEAFVALGEVPGWWEEGGGGDYPIDYYAADGGQWNSTYHRRKPRAEGKTGPLLAALAGASRAAAAATAAGVAGGGGKGEPA